MKEITVSGKSIDEAVAQALEQLETTKENVEINVIEEPKKGFLGIIGTKPARVQVVAKPNPIREALVYLETVLEQMGLKAKISINKISERSCDCEIKSEQIAVIIGKRGQTLNALQDLTNLVANKKSQKKIRIMIDAEGYRARRKEALQKLAERVANKVKKTNRSSRLEPMPSFERKVIHTALQYEKGINTTSNGEEPTRFVMILPEKE